MNTPLWNKIYPEEEQKRILALEETNEKLEELLKGKRKKFNERLEPIWKAIFHNNFTMNNSKVIVDTQAEVLTLRQEINDNIGVYSQRLAKSKSENALLSQQQFLLYSTNFGLKTNLGEKKLLIEGHLRENDRYCNLLEIHIEFLRETLKTLESYQYAIKNVISLIEYLGK
jgi:molybdopterin converting factor small subunit